MEGYSGGTLEGATLLWSTSQATPQLLPLETISVTSEYPQDGGLVFCCYDYCVDPQLQNCMIRCLHIIGLIMSDTCHAGQEYSQDFGCWKKVDGRHSVLIEKSCVAKSSYHVPDWSCFPTLS